MEFFLKESSYKALSEHLEIKNFENSPFLTLADTLKNILATKYMQAYICSVSFSYDLDIYSVPFFILFPFSFICVQIKQEILLV